MNLLKISHQLGEVHADVRTVVRAQGAMQNDLEGLDKRLAALESQIKTRRFRERLVWAAVTTVGAMLWGVAGFVPIKVWAAVAQALAHQ